MITGKIVLKSATKLSLDQRFGEIAKQAPPPPPPPRIPQQTNVIIPQSRQELFGNKRSATMNLANRLKKRSINYRRGFDNNIAPSRPFVNPRTPRVFQRISFGNRRRGGGGGGANSYLFGGQSGMGVRLGAEGRVGTRIFRSQRRGYPNNNGMNRFGGFQRRGYNNNRGGRFINRPYRGRGAGRGNRGFVRGRGNGRGNDRGRGNGRGNGRGMNRGNNRNNNNNPNCTKESLDNDLEKYMSQTKIDDESVDMNAV